MPCTFEQRWLLDAQSKTSHQRALQTISKASCYRLILSRQSSCTITRCSNSICPREPLNLAPGYQHRYRANTSENAPFVAWNTVRACCMKPSVPMYFLTSHDSFVLVRFCMLVFVFATAHVLFHSLLCNAGANDIINDVDQT